MTMRKIEFLERVKTAGATWEEGDVRSFPEKEASEYIRVGWAKCSETGETGDRKPGSQKIDVESVKTSMR